MSRHRLVRNYDYGADLDEFEEEEYDEDTYDDGLYDGTEEPAAEYTEEEERAFMEQAKGNVVAMLGAENAAKVPSGKVEESILYYDYDEAKAVSYLMRTYVEVPEPAGKKAKAASQEAPGTAFLADFFSDMPWLNVPRSRMAVLVPPQQPRGGLLGGSSSAAAPKMSKLQALAAQRKRKAEEAKKSKEAGGGGPASGEQADADVRELRNKAAKLAIDGPAQRSPRETTSASTARKATPTSPPAEPSSLPPTAEPLAMKDIHHEKLAPVKADPAMIAQPSAFAQALFGPKKHKQKQKPNPTQDESSLLAVPSLSRAPPSAFDAFLEPSPDDVVLDAQAKGWRRGQTKK
ncbi:hypothetical protein Sste5346_000656 [Sporothrix stenoceras]|uniref:HBS1-like protein N-terminal domain-containing protein n=1 Tax=Sporothrix stenoceras TaxID=5173 RepID=A0ABR3ZRQ5_9PEZI